MAARTIDRRHLLATGGGLAMTACLAPVATAQTLFTPERFGAKGDGRSDDSAAFARLADAVNAAGGGTVVLRKTTYLVGTQRPGPGGPVEARLMSFADCRRPLVIQGNGAVLRCAPGQRYGMFLPDGTPMAEITKSGVGMARPYAAMIEASNCSGGVTIQDIELDGNSGALILGGRRGDKGYQIGCVGLALRNNPGPEHLLNVYSHHQPHDGFYVDGPRYPTPGVARQLIGLRADANGRQGMSIVGGQDYRIERSSFTRTARGQVVGVPGAGVDIEAERKKQIRNLAFVACHFADNRGCGLVADSGDSADISFTDCSFVGTDNWAAWPDKPGYHFERCSFAGSVVHVFGDPDPARATRFTDCLFTDDPKLSPTGRLVLRKSPASLFGQAENVLLDRCRFIMTHDGVLPSSDAATYRNCTMSQSSPRPAAMRGRFEGRNVITGAVDLGASPILGETIVNGRALPRRG
jgi:hypothetical protein